MAAHSAKTQATWKCPKCGREFARKSPYHGCGQYTLEGYLKGKNPAAIALFNKVVAVAQSIGPITVSPAKTQVSLRVRSNFAMISLTGAQICGYLFLPEPRPAQFVRKITASSARRHVHHFRIDDPTMLNGDFPQMLAEAIAMASDQEPPQKSSKRPRGIGDEINSFHRALRKSNSLQP
jgi:hypothetical protein